LEGRSPINPAVTGLVEGFIFRFSVLGLGFQFKVLG